MITLITGQVGSGKTFHAVHMIIDALKSGRNVFTNIQLRTGKIDAMLQQIGSQPGKLFQFRDPIIDKNDKPMTPYCDLFRREGDQQLKDALIVLDEATYWFPAGRLDDDVTRFLQRQRHSGIDVVIVCPDAQNLPAALRRLVQYHQDIVDWAVSVTKILPFMPPPPLRIRKIRAGFLGPVVSIQPFKIDPAIAEFYDTTGGTYGMEPASTSNREIVQRKKQGWKALVQFAIAAGVFIGFVAYTVTQIATGGIFKTIQNKTEQSIPQISKNKVILPSHKTTLPPNAIPIGGTTECQFYTTPEGLYISQKQGQPPQYFATIDALVDLAMADLSSTKSSDTSTKTSLLPTFK